MTSATRSGTAWAATVGKGCEVKTLKRSPSQGQLGIFFARPMVVGLCRSSSRRLKLVQGFLSGSLQLLSPSSIRAASVQHLRLQIFAAPFYFLSTREVFDCTHTSRYRTLLALNHIDDFLTAPCTTSDIVLGPNFLASCCLAPQFHRLWPSIFVPVRKVALLSWLSRLRCCWALPL